MARSRACALESLFRNSTLLLVFGSSLSTSGPAIAASRELGTFVDRAAEWGLDFTHFNGMSGSYYLLEITGAGGALVDYDNDGDLDVYLVQGHMLGTGVPVTQALMAPRHPLPLTDRLYRNDLVLGSEGQTTVRFVDVTATSGIDSPGYGMGVTAADYDNNGTVDLYITNYDSNQMLRNNGDGTFTDVTAATGTDDRRWSVPASFFDFDGDGWLDLYVGNYVLFDFSLHFQCPNALGVPGYCGPLSYAAQGDSLFRNRGDGTFENVTDKSGIGSEFGNALGSVVADVNNDGWLDLYVANDQVPNILWINSGKGTFRNEALFAGCAVNSQGQPEASMGVDAADFDGDGDEDLFMGHLTHETNTLYLNDGNGIFSDATELFGLGNPSWEATTFGTAWFDMDLDGLLDVFAANGAVLLIPALVQEHDPFPLHQPNQVFHNLGNGRFEDVTSRLGPVFELSEVSRGAVVGDIDNDGDPDLLVTNNSGPARLLINERRSPSAWLGVEVEDCGTGSDRLGARVAVRTSRGATQWRRVRTDGGYASARDPRILFGLDTQPAAAELEIQTPGGARRRYRNPTSDSYLTVCADRGATIP